MIRVCKPAILDALPAEKGVVQASAGTGKTYLLERMVVDLILKGLKLEQILVVTFTEKATLELKARIRAMLERLVALPEDTREEGDPAWEIDGDGVQALAEALRSFDRATISTIHGFCRRVLQEGAFEGGSLLRQELADGRALLARAWREVVRRDAAGDLGAFLEEVLASGLGFDGIEDLLWQAHAERGRLLPEPDADPDRVLAAYPAHWAGRWPELEAAIAALDLHAATRRAFKARLGALLELMTERPSAYRLCGEWDFHYLEDHGIAPAGQELWEWIEAFHRAAGSTEAMVVQRLLPPVRLRLREIKDSEGLYDHDDSILQVAAALDGPGGADLAARLRERYRAALIDEFQDTDQAQWSIFRTCFGVPGHTLFVIGDPKQAIYGFRGGDLPTYRAAAAALLDGAPAQELGENHRSTPGVIEAYNLIFTGGVRHAKDPSLDTAFFSDPELYPERAAVRCGNPRLSARTGAGAELAPVRVLRLATLDGGAVLWRGVARALAREIGQLIRVTGVRFGDPEATDPGRRVRALDFGDVQVLVEKHRQGLEMAEALRLEGIPCCFFKQDGLLESTEARDLLDCLGAVLDPRNRTCLARALVTPFFGYPWADLEALKQLPEDHPALLRLFQWQNLAHQRQFPRLFEAMLHQGGLIQRLRLSTGSERALTNHLHLTELLLRHARDHSADLADLVRLMKRWMAGSELPPGENGSIQRLEGERQAVQILTMHQSKGLEAPVVALYGFTRPGGRSKVKRFHRGAERCLYLGTPPGAIAATVEAERAAEAERLFYVALTRAQAQLLLPCFVVDKALKTGSKPGHPAGNYGILNRRLRELIQGAARPDLFQEVPVEPEAPGAPTPAGADLAGWSVPEPPRPVLPDYAGIRRGAQPPFTTSYTALHGLRDPLAARREEDPGMVLDGEAEGAGAPPQPDDLPRGARTGILLHQLLEQVDLGSAEGLAFEAWWAAPGRQEWVEQALGGAGLRPVHAPRVARLVYEALGTPLSGAPLARASHVLRELAFLTRYLDTEDLIQGAMDLVFERDGRIHLLDWKSDTLADYGAAALDARVRGEYLIQIQIYLGVVLDYFGIGDAEAYERRFAELHYVFLRGLPGQGVWSWHPAWAEIQAWRADLRQLHERVAHV